MVKRTFPDEKELESNRRIDFLCTKSSGVDHVIELKRPNIKLTVKQIQQIAEYVEFTKKHFPQSIDKVKGYLISDNMTYEPGAEIVRKGLESESIFVKSYSDYWQKQGCITTSYIITILKLKIRKKRVIDYKKHFM